MMNGNRDIAREVADDLWSAMALLTRLPVPDHVSRGAGAAWAWPIVGAVLGGLAAVVVVMASGIGLPSGVAAAFGLIVPAVLTGALHEDGLADTADGFFGGQSPERRLEIMKDSHIGSFGTLALVLVTLVRWSALSALCASGHATVALIIAGAASRVPMVVLMAALPSARATGLSHLVGRPTLQSASIAAGLGLLVSLVLSVSASLWLVPVLGALTALIGVLALRRIGGQTGDVLGASQQLADAACLAVLAAALVA